MSDALSFAEIDGQHVELLPARTVLSLFSTGGGGKGGDGGAAAPPAANYGGDGGDAKGKAALFDNYFYTEGDVYNNVTGGAGGTGGAGAVAGAPAGGGM
ncbi:MAG: hypothetical protein ACRDRG_04645 [Pseudonocardiaceae bacterium]